MRTMSPCPTCQGAGTILRQVECSTCDGAHFDPRSGRECATCHGNGVIAKRGTCPTCGGQRVLYRDGHRDGDLDA